MNIQGTLFSATSSESYQAALVLESGQLFLKIEGQPLPTKVNQHRIHRRLGDLPRILELDGMRFETSQFELVETLEKQFQQSNWIHRLENNGKLILATAAAAVAALLLTYFFGIPAFSESIAPRVPEVVKDKLSMPTQKFFERLHVDPNLVLDEAANIRFTDAKTKLRQIYPTRDFDIYLLDMPGPNAFIIPNGTIYMTQHLVELSESSDELLAIFLHEVGHWSHHHVMQRVIENSAISLIYIAITGGTEWMNVPLILLTNQYSQKSELEADQYALIRLKQYNIDSKSFQNIFERIEKYANEKDIGELPSFLSTHPSFKERIDQIKKFE